jgi:hypothetical protein
MKFTYQLGNFQIRKLNLEREVNYEIYDSTGYVCRLVPGYSGFELSKLDRCLETVVSDSLIGNVGDYIINLDA